MHVCYHVIMLSCPAAPEKTTIVAFAPQVGKGKEGCGRVVVRKHLGIVRAYTMEASFMGADQVRDCGFTFFIVRHTCNPRFPPPDEVHGLKGSFHLSTSITGYAWFTR